MADPQSQPGAIALPELVERLRNGGESAVAGFTQEELEAIVDDLPLALESEEIREHLSPLVARIERQKHRTFRRIVEIARQDDERTPILLAALKHLGFSGEPTDEEFAWLVHVMSTNTNAMARLDAFDQALRLALQPALQGILEAVATIHPDEAIRAQMAETRGDALGGSVPDGALFTGDDLVGDLGDIAIPDEGAAEPTPAGDDAAVASGESAGASAGAESEATPPAGADDAAAWMDYEEKPPDRLTVRTLLRSVDGSEDGAGAAQIGPAPDASAPEAPGTEIAPDDPSLAGFPVAPASAADEAGTPADATMDAAPPALASAADEEAAWTAEEEIPPERLTVRTLLRSVDSSATDLIGQVSPAPAPADASGTEAASEEAAAANGSSETVDTMLRSLETVKLSLRELETAKGVLPTPTALTSDRTPPPPRAGETPTRPDAPWKNLDLKPMQPAERARALAKIRRELKPNERRPFLMWLLEREADALFGASIRREILEFAFDRTFFYAFDAPTRARLGRWIRERAAADALTPAAILAALRRATWTEGEPPRIDEETRPVVDAASGILGRVPSEERVALLTRDFTAWLFAVREFEDREVLDRWARDPSPGVSEGLFRALAAMDASASKLGVTEGPTALELALGVWDRCDVEGRIGLANAIAAGWSRGFVLDRARFFESFWKRYRENDNQREAVLIALASFEKEIEGAHIEELASEGFVPPPPEDPAVEQAAVDAVEHQEDVVPPEGAPADDGSGEAGATGETDGAAWAGSAPAEGEAEAEAEAQPVDAVTPGDAPAIEDSAPSEAKVLASLFGKRKPGETAAATPAQAAAAPAAPSSSAGVPPAAGDENEVTESEDDGTANRYFQQKRRELERVMRQISDAPGAPTAPTAPVPSDPSEEPTDPRRPGTAARAPNVATAPTPASPPADESSLSDEDLAGDFIPDEGEAMLTDEERANSGPKRLPRGIPPAAPIATASARPSAAAPAAVPPGAPPAARPVVRPEATPIRPNPLPSPGAGGAGAKPQAPASAPAPATAPASSKQVAASTPDHEVVLPSEPLRTLAEYTGFLRALSGGTSIDELLGRHGMDYRQYAACMTAWGKLLQGRPDLALRMGQLLRSN